MPRQRRRTTRPRGNRPPYALLAAAAGSALWLALWQTTRLHPYVAWLIAWSCVTFALYWWDKGQAQAHRWRVPEMVMHASSAIGGFAGGWLGTIWCRHKTLKPSFLAVLLISSVVHAFVLMQVVG